MKDQRHPLTLPYLAKNFGVVLGLVLVWRGVWYVLDWIDLTFLDNNHAWLGAGGIILGLLILYLPDRDLKEIQKL